VNASLRRPRARPRAGSVDRHRLTRELIDRLEDDRILRRARTPDWVMVDEGERDLILDRATGAAAAKRTL
jgi:hypothetical protein